MILPAAAAPVAVLVLAWDEATPAVRALVEATEATEPLLDSVVVLVPAGPAPEEALREEFLPLAPLPTPPAPLPPSAPVGGPLAAPAAASLATLAPATALALPLLPVLGTPTAALPAELVADAPLSPRVPPLPVPTVRVLHLSAFSLAELAALAGQALPLPTWTGSSAWPAAPYVGSEAVALAGNNPSQRSQPASNLAIADAKPDLPATALPPSPAPEPLTPDATAASLSYLPGESPALDAEADAAPMLLADAENDAEAVATPGLTTTLGAAQAGWPQALASLREPLALDEAKPADLEDEAAYYADVDGAQAELPASLAQPAPPALRPAGQTFEAPNLNFQVIQYARFAVPVALAQEAFAAIYAPAWPTWLAAQELRYRTGRPLVLHVNTLAAGETESVETATSWQAELQRQALRRADLILAETPALAHRLRHDLGLPPELVRTVPAADTAAIAQALRSAQPRPKASAS